MPSSDDHEFNALLRKAGIDAATVEAVMSIDGMLQQWRRRAMKRELGHRALQDLHIGIDLAQFDILAAIKGPRLDAGCVPAEPMIATVAERLNIDPSRASRLVSEVVELGLARRAVSQADARRTIIELTDKGTAILDRVLAYKYLVMGDFLASWSREELESFVPLLKRFSNWVDGIDSVAEKYAPDIEALAAGIEQGE